EYPQRAAERPRRRGATLCRLVLLGAPAPPAGLRLVGTARGRGDRLARRAFAPPGGRGGGGMSMPESLGTLVLAALAWLAIHFGIAGTRLRGAIVARIGEGPFRGLFSAASLAALWFLAVGYRAAPTTPLWTAPPWLRWILVLAMLPAFVLFVAALVTPSP